MSKSNFIKVFSLEVLHTFFEDNKCTCLQFRAAEITQQLMKRFGFLVRYNANGFEMYTDTSSSLPEFLSYISRSMPDYFDFSVQTEKQNFNLFTDMPFNSGSICYDSASGIAAENGSVILQPQFLNNDSISLAAIKINFADVLSNIVSSGAARFQIYFKARVTQWQYYIVNKSDIHFNNPGVAGKYNIRFNGPFNAATPGGDVALLFTSGESLLPLSENAKYRFDLVNNFDPQQAQAFTSESNILYKGLPVPDPWSTLHANNNGTPIFTSPVYVYL